MDKLQPIINNRFWILAGLVLPMAMYGFFSANSKLKAATNSRETDLETTLKGIPAGTTAPNEEYAAGLAKINGVYSKTVDQSIRRIWGTQQSRMTWPPVVETYRPRVFLGEFDYRGIVAYQEAYERLMLDLQARVEPVMPLDKKSGGVGGGRPMRQEEIADVPWKQKVILAASIPQAHFGRMRATSKEVWDAQIDIWLLRLLYDAVARLNEDKDSVTEAILRRIDVLNLVGGDGEPVLTGGDSSGGGGGGGYGGVGGDEMFEGMAGGGGGGGGYGAESVGGGGGTTSMSIAFNPAQEFGSDADTSGDDSAASDSSYGGGMTTTMSRNSAKLRYIADEEDKPYLERGFYMSVIIMQDKIPDFLVELANSEWPVRVTRFHVGKNPYYTGATNNSSRYGSSSGSESSLYEEGMESYSSGGGGGASYESKSAFGGVGGNLPGIEGVGALTQNLPPMADAAMQHPNLVQLDLCGVITMYKQPQSIIDAIENGGGEKPVTAPGSEEIAPINDDSISDESGDAPLDPASEESIPPASPAATEPGAAPETSTEPPADSGSDTGTNPAPKDDSTNTLEPENL